MGVPEEKESHVKYISINNSLFFKNLIKHIDHKYHKLIKCFSSDEHLTPYTQRHMTVNLLKSKTIEKNTESSKRISTHYIYGNNDINFA